MSNYFCGLCGRETSLFTRLHVSLGLTKIVKIENIVRGKTVSYQMEYILYEIVYNLRRLLRLLNKVATRG